MVPTLVAHLATLNIFPLRLAQPGLQGHLSPTHAKSLVGLRVMIGTLFVVVCSPFKQIKLFTTFEFNHGTCKQKYPKLE